LRNCEGNFSGKKSVVNTSVKGIWERRKRRIVHTSKGHSIHQMEGVVQEKWGGQPCSHGVKKAGTRTGRNHKEGSYYSNRRASYLRKETGKASGGAKTL